MKFLANEIVICNLFVGRVIILRFMIFLMPRLTSIGNKFSKNHLAND